jgi:hypothetical protein
MDERRSPRTKATVNQLLDRYLEVIELEPTTRQGYVGKIDKRIRPTIGTMQVGRLDGGRGDVRGEAAEQAAPGNHRRLTTARDDRASRRGAAACIPPSVAGDLPHPWCLRAEGTTLSK